MDGDAQQHDRQHAQRTATAVMDRMAHGRHSWAWGSEVSGSASGFGASDSGVSGSGAPADTAARLAAYGTHRQTHGPHAGRQATVTVGRAVAEPSAQGVTGGRRRHQWPRRRTNPRSAMACWHVTTRPCHHHAMPQGARSPDAVSHAPPQPHGRPRPGPRSCSEACAYPYPPLTRRARTRTPTRAETRGG